MYIQSAISCPPFSHKTLSTLPYLGSPLKWAQTVCSSLLCIGRSLRTLLGSSGAERASCPSDLLLSSRRRRRDTAPDLRGSRPGTDRLRRQNDTDWLLGAALRDWDRSAASHVTCATAERSGHVTGSKPNDGASSPIFTASSQCLTRETLRQIRENSFIHH